MGMNIRFVKAGSLEQLQLERYTERIEHSTEQSIRMAKARGCQRCSTVLLEALGTTALLYVSGHQVLDGVLSPGELSTFFMLANEVMSDSKDLLALYAQFQGAIGATRRVFGLIEAEPGLVDTGTVKDPIRGEFRMQGIHLRYHGDVGWALCDVNLDFVPRGLTALVGPSGSGKSSIASLLLRLYSPTRGKIWLDGRELNDFSLRWFHAHTSLVSQEPVLFSCSIRDNIAYGCESSVSQSQIEAAARIANAHDFIMRLPDGYDTQCGERGCCLSGGERQRLAIAVEVIRDPKILILDEATSALDSLSEQHVKSAMARVMPGRTTVMIAHRLSTVREADKIVVMDQGRVVEEGNHDQLMQINNGRYQRLLAAQMDYIPVASKPEKVDNNLKHMTE